MRRKKAQNHEKLEYNMHVTLLFSLCYNASMNNFFISGPIQIGKSTLLRKCLAGFASTLGGFSSQRIREKDTGDILGFSLMPASDFCIEVHIDISDLPSKDNLFLCQSLLGQNLLGQNLLGRRNDSKNINNDRNDKERADRNCEKNDSNKSLFDFDPEVFVDAGVRFLENYRDCDLMLLDEIGGVELLVPPFKEKLYEVLESPVPCIGVLKGISNASSFSNKKVLAENTLLRDFLTKDTNSEVISLTGKTFR